MYLSVKKYGHNQGLSCCFRQWRASSHCNLIHGYALAFELAFECESLDANHWVQDFGSLKPIKEWLHYMFDHTYLCATDDPARPVFEELDRAKLIDLHLVEAVGCEAIARLVYKHVATWLASENPKARLRYVKVSEHDGNHAIYEG